MKLHHLFIPHPKTHQKSPLLSWYALVVYILIFILLRSGFNLLNTYKPGILGINSSITTEQIVEETNKERTNMGLEPLILNTTLSEAARLKALNMFEENYWAHFAPSGKTPWSFILGTGYKFSYAGENLARNFYTSEDTVRAWMNSPTHKENMINPRYKDIGVAVVDGVLLGQKTTLVVQMFGKSLEPLVAANKSTTVTINLGGSKIGINNSEVENSRSILEASSKASSLPNVGKSILDPYILTRSFGMFVIALVATLLAIDLVALKRRGVFRISSHHVAHLSFLVLSSISLAAIQTGGIL